jgi:tetratricopeptide (TPR) repeat protein
VRRGRQRIAAIAACASLLALGCAGAGTTGRPRAGHPKSSAPGAAPSAKPEPLPAAAAPLHLSDLADEGDAARRASMRLVLEGLEADAAGASDSATRIYQRALQVDPANPYAYLALARQRAESDRPDRALPYLEKASALLGSQRAQSPSVDAHLEGLRGLALAATGRTDEAEALLARARALAPDAWSDGKLDADELR